MHVCIMWEHVEFLRLGTPLALDQRIFAYIEPLAAMFKVA